MRSKVLILMLVAALAGCGVLRTGAGLAVGAGQATLGAADLML